MLSVVLLALQAQTFALSPADVADSAALARSMPRLAAAVLSTYRDADRARFLNNAFRLQILTGKYDDAATSLTEWRRLRPGATHVQYAIYVDARRRATRGQPFAAAFAESFHAVFATLDDATAAVVARTILLAPNTVASDLRWATPDQSAKTTVALDDALTLLGVYAAVESYRGFAGLAATLVAGDDDRRYLISYDVPVRTPDSATVCATIVRPRAAGGRLPTLLQFTIYADSAAGMREALRAASHGYVGVTAYSRGKACSPDRIEPYVHDGADAAAVIAWIAQQPWSDGRVGMYGGSYSGFTPWAAAKHMPPALKAIMVGAPVAPAVDVPMEGNVALSFVYPWPFYAMNNKWLDNATYNQFRRWNQLYIAWYRSGRPYRDLEQIDGTPNPGFAAWLAHPTVDAYWQATIPQDAEYKRITIPVLQTAGYFFGGPGAATYYFLEHTKHNPRAEHYLLLGPYDHFQAQRGVVTALSDTATYFAGYVIDPAAQIDIVADLRYQWFDYVLRGGAKPALLKDRVNYQVMGANVWKHAPSIAAASNNRLRLYLHPGAPPSLRAAPAPSAAFIAQTVNLADRSDADARRGGGILSPVIDTANGVMLVSEPLDQATEMTGLLSGHLELETNKKDFDFMVTLYELTAAGQYFQLPPYTSRASHVVSLSERRLLVPGKRERLDFAAYLRPMSRLVAAGSRLVVVLSVVKGAGQQINYGTGKNVSDESVADAGEPLVIKWLGGSYVDAPVNSSADQP